MAIHFKRQAAVSPAATQDQNPNEPDHFCTKAIMTLTTKIRATSEQATARRKESGAERRELTSRPSKRLTDSAGSTLFTTTGQCAVEFKTAARTGSQAFTSNQRIGPTGPIRRI